MWAMAAPASAASSADVAICSGVIGRYGDCSGLVRLPVMAQVMMVLPVMKSNDPLLLQRLDLSGIIAELAAEHFLCVFAEQRRGAVGLDRGLRESQRVADQGELRLELVLGLDPHAARLDVGIAEHLLEIIDRTGRHAGLLQS